jgi:hypothetical protein
MRDSSLNPNSSTLEGDRPQYDSTAACVVAEHYSSATLYSLGFHCRKEKQGSGFQNIITSVFNSFLQLRKF